MSKDKKKKLSDTVSIVINAGEAVPGPPVGTALGPKGINLGEFCKKFNELATSKFEKGTPVPAVISIYEDRSFDFIVKAPPVSYLIRKAIGLAKGSSVPRKEIVGKITVSQIEKIAEVKMQYMNTNDMSAAVSMIRGSAKSMGIEVVDE